MKRATKEDRKGYYAKITELVERYRRTSTSDGTYCVAKELKELLVSEWTAEAVVACCDSEREALQILCLVLNKFIDDAPSVELD